MHIPELGSIWEARDGRRVQIIKIVQKATFLGGWWAELYVLPPYKSRQKKHTQADMTSFMSGFYKQELQ